MKEKFSFPKTTEDYMEIEIKCLDKNKPSTFNNIPEKHLKQTNDVCSPLLTKIYNDTKENGDFPNSLKNNGHHPQHIRKEKQLIRTITDQ